jgi:hypothetical protein
MKVWKRSDPSLAPGFLSSAKSPILPTAIVLLKSFRHVHKNKVHSDPAAEFKNETKKTKWNKIHKNRHPN